MLWIKGTCQWGTSREKESLVQIWACVDSATRWGENFMEKSFVVGKFCDTRVNHENNPVWFISILEKIFTIVHGCDWNFLLLEILAPSDKAEARITNAAVIPSVMHFHFHQCVICYDVTITFTVRSLFVSVYCACLLGCILYRMLAVMTSSLLNRKLKLKTSSIPWSELIE